MNDSKHLIRVLIVDDSAFMRRAIAKMLESEADLRVVGTAATGEAAIAQQVELQPDVITMDVEMPGIGGLEAARAIIGRRGPPIIMLSSLTRDGADTTLRALELGAVDFVPKPNAAYIDILRVKRDLVEKIRLFGTRQMTLRLPAKTAPAPPPRATVPFLAAAAPLTPVPPLAVSAPALGGPPPASGTTPATRAVAPRATRAMRTAAFACVALGTSTGGPVALANVLPKLPAHFPLPIIIVQHMPLGFTKPLAERLNAACQITVVEGQNGMLLEPGKAIIAPAGQQLKLKRRLDRVEVWLEPDTKKSLHVPSVDIMSAAVGEMFGASALGVILTGMGHDGVEGLAVIKKLGGYVIGQDEASAVVYGMPRAAAVAGLVDRVVALNDVARVLCEVAGAAYIGAA